MGLRVARDSSIFFTIVSTNRSSLRWNVSAAAFNASRSSGVRFLIRWAASNCRPAPPSPLRNSGIRAAIKFILEFLRSLRLQMNGN